MIKGVARQLLAKAMSGNNSSLVLPQTAKLRGKALAELDIFGRHDWIRTNYLFHVKEAL